jgi:hypothetical protein
MLITYPELLAGNKGLQSRMSAYPSWWRTRVVPITALLEPMRIYLIVSGSGIVWKIT